MDYISTQAQGTYNPAQIFGDIVSRNLQRDTANQNFALSRGQLAEQQRGNTLNYNLGATNAANQARATTLDTANKNADRVQNQGQFNTQQTNTVNLANLQADTQLRAAALGQQVAAYNAWMQAYYNMLGQAGQLTMNS